MIHFTVTGVYAGKPYCTSSKQNLPATDEFTHLPYNQIAMDNLLNNPDVCPKCKAIYTLLLDDTLTDDEWDKQVTAILKG